MPAWRGGGACLGGGCLPGGGVPAWGGACLGGGACLEGGCLPGGGAPDQAPPPNTVNARPVRILLECILVLLCYCALSYVLCSRGNWSESRFLTVPGGNYARLIH